MLGAGLGIRVATVQAAGQFDSHENQLGSHGDDLADVGDSLVAFQRDLEARGLADRVLTLVWSEFGRRVEDNASNGTDHGAGSLVLAVGNPRAPPSRTAGTSPTARATTATCPSRSTSATSTRASSTATWAATSSAASRATEVPRSRSSADGHRSARPGRDGPDGTRFVNVFAPRAKRPSGLWRQRTAGTNLGKVGLAQGSGRPGRGALRRADCDRLPADHTDGARVGPRRGPVPERRRGHGARGRHVDRDPGPLLHGHGAGRAQGPGASACCCARPRPSRSAPTPAPA